MKSNALTRTNQMNGFVDRSFLWLLGLVLVILSLPLIWTSSFAITLLSEIGIAITFALAYNMLLGQGGMLSFGHAVYFGFGGYLTIHATNMIGEGSLALPLELVPLVGGLAGLTLAVLFGHFSTKKAGIAFALISLGIVELVVGITVPLKSFFGGDEGITTDRVVDFTLTGLEFAQGIEVYYLIAFWTLVCVLLMYLQTQTPLGRMINAVRDNSERAEFIGYNPHLVRYFQFCLSGFFAGIAGGLLAINYEIIDSTSMASAPVIFMAFIGGSRYFFGPIIGATIYTVLHLTLGNYTQAWSFYLGIFFIFLVLRAPRGVAGLIMMHGPFLQARMLGKLLPFYLRTAFSGLITFSGIIILIELIYQRNLATIPGPLVIYGISLDPGQILPWISALSIIAVGAVFLYPAIKATAKKWDDMMEILDQQKESL